MTSRAVLFFASQSLRSDTPLRIAASSLPAAEEALLAALRACSPHGREVAIDLGPEGAEAERALLDYWAELPPSERSRVWAVTGALAGALLRFEDRRPSLAFAVIGSPGLAEGRPPNAQARSLLMAAHPDTWTLALDSGPEVDAGLWRCRLSAVVSQRWGLGLLEDPAAYAAFLKWLRLDSPAASGFQARIESPQQHPVRDADWLDAELYESCASPKKQRPTRMSAEPQLDAIAASALESKVLRGKAGRLFLAHDSYESHRQIIGERPLSSDELDAWERGTAARMADLGPLGSRLVHLIGPAPQVVHPDELPDSMAVSSARPALQVLERLGAMRPRPEVLYPLAELVEVRKIHDPFSKTDSHWNDLGAYIAYEAVMDQLGDGVPARRVARTEVSFQETCYTGDLGGKLRPQRASIFLRARLDHPRARVVEDNLVRNHGRRAVFECEAAPPGTCHVFGDSWAYAMMLFLAESFRRVVFYHRVNVVDRSPVERERPEVVLMVLTERFCAALPDPPDTPPFERVVKKKVRGGDLVPAAPPNQRHAFLFSLALDRGLPAGPGFRLPSEPATG
ncbi:MAG TPA: hypothetical protein VGN09_24810 [Vicinamibacteria bacterium]